MNKKRRNKKNKYIYIVVILIVSLAITLFYMAKSNKKLNVFESLIKDTVIVTQKFFYTPIKNFNNILNDIKNLSEVLEENKILKSNVEKLESLETENIELKQEINKLKTELDINYVLSEYTYLNATVISRNVSYWYNTITIDKGSYNGVEVDMVVVNSDGLIGKVVSTTTFTSDVKILTTSDTNNKISVAISNGKNKLYGLIKDYNYKNNYLEVEGISNTESVSIGDYVYTSGLGGVFPSGILIGTVEEITTDEYDLAKIINVKLSANFDNINYVAILKRKEQTK